MARPEDLPAMTAIRISVSENHMSVEQMAERGIPPDGTLAEMAAGDLGAWVAEEQDGLVAFAMADRRNASLFALFTKPGREGKGHGSALLAAAEAWLIEMGHREAWLTTATDSRAAAFYALKGRRTTDEGDPGDTLFRKSLAR
ncbi:GNAT family N-acetyltransferase [Nordella sp. HKS 07]|uniref:GNAT family N-acetyltransferase n=1 Tax=Nordella sp. HKS 07 TaxID=2712222 RepID=UPI0013E1C939|nr:GNAT family N-acetyltransferase [Nordella sp. HKS 07]QIG46897.1 GNAT family N-acetyltransferase [Nordella sp. HKS 07]